MAGRFSPLDYAFAVGRIRALENYLIPYPVFREAAEAPSLDRAVELISDAGKFGEELLEIRTSDQLEKFLLKEKIGLDFTLQELFLEKDFYHYYQAAEEIKEIASSLTGVSNLFIQDYFRQRIDLSNLKLFLRCRYLEWPASQFEQKFILGGNLEKKLFTENYDSELEEFGQVIRSTPYLDVWKQGVDFLTSKESFVALEREIESLLMNYLKRAKRITFGPEPVFAYGLAKKQELRLVRMVLAGKLLQVPASILKERISQTYV
ncbi:MAG: V-type ATPase subunit [Candidatus Aminicenantes bacterium]|nr:V-type ATPase subunit [Candidatus Aminicenantes bacterium]